MHNINNSKAYKMTRDKSYTGVSEKDGLEEIMAG